MANNASNYLETALLNHIFKDNGGSAYTPPANDSIFVSLHTGAPSENGTHGTSNEVTVGSTSYTRSNASGSLTFSVSGNAATNGQAIAFPQATANYNAAVTHIGIYDGGTPGAGNLLFYGALTVNKTVTTGDTFQVNAGALTITLE